MSIRYTLEESTSLRNNTILCIKIELFPEAKCMGFLNLSFYLPKMSTTTTEEIITINVGGTIFSTTRNTLTKFNGSVLACMFGIEQQMKPSIVDKNGNYFIDRDPVLFSEILSMCRKGKIPQNVDGPLRAEIKYWFPEYSKKSEDEIFVKSVATAILQSLHSPDIVYHSSWRVPWISGLPFYHDYFIDDKDDPNSYREFLSYVESYQNNLDRLGGPITHSLPGFCLYAAVSREQRKQYHHTVFKYDEISKDHEFHTRRFYEMEFLLKFARDDIKIQQRAVTIWNKFAADSKKIAQFPIRDMLCKMLDKKLPNQLKAIWVRLPTKCQKNLSSVDTEYTTQEGAKFFSDDRIPCKHSLALFPSVSTIAEELSSNPYTDDDPDSDSDTEDHIYLHPLYLFYRNGPFCTCGFRDSDAVVDHAILIIYRAHTNEHTPCDKTLWPRHPIAEIQAYLSHNNLQLQQPVELAKAQNEIQGLVSGIRDVDSVQP